MVPRGQIGHIDPVLPGHIEVYNLARTGKVSLDRVTRFHTIGDAPKYKLLTAAQGKCVICLALLSHSVVNIIMAVVATIDHNANIVYNNNIHTHL